MARYSLVSVLSTEIDVGHRRLGVHIESVANALSLELDLDIHTIVDNNVESVLESLNFIGNTTHRDGLLFLGLDHAIPLDHLPDRVLVLGERGIFGVNLTYIRDFECLAFVNKHFDLSKVQFLLV